VRSSPTPVIDGTKFLRFSSNVAGGVVYQDVVSACPPVQCPVNPSSVDSYAFTVYVRSATVNCVKGTAATFGSGITTQPGYTRFEVCGTQWRPIFVPLDSNYANTFVRVAVYVDEANNSIDIDGTEFVQLLTDNSSFEAATTPWGFIHPSGGFTSANLIPDTTYNESASGDWYLQTRRSGGTGASSVYQDVHTIPSPGESYRVYLWLRRDPGSSGTAYATVSLWVMGTGQNAQIVNIPLSSSVWTLYTKDITVSSAGGNALRVEVYFNTSNKYYDIDGVKFFKMN
jgi:hypothetical protein